MSQASVPRGSHAPEPLTAHQQAFGRVLEGTAVLAGVVHLSFLVLMAWVQVLPLAAVNVLSVLCYVAMYRLARRQRLEAALVLGMAEVVGHAALAVWLIGWGSGFHFYILLTVPVAMLNAVAGSRHKNTMAVLLAVAYLVLDVLVRRSIPVYAISPAVIETLHYINLSTTILLLMVLAGFYQRQISAAEQSLLATATTDAQTGLCNRRAMVEAVQQATRRARRGGEPLAFLLIDIDHFKAVNDRHGHRAGDAALVAVAQALAAAVREVDVLGRWGGEEFLVVLPGTDEAAAALVAERLRGAVALRVVRVDGIAEPLALTASLGVSELGPDETAEQAISRADRALYEGKRAGRNRVVRAGLLPAA